MAVHHKNWWLALLTATILAGSVLAEGQLAGAETDGQDHTAVKPVTKSHTAMSQIVTVDWKDLSLSEAAKQLQTLSGITVVVDERALNDGGISETAKLTCTVRDLPLRYALLHALDALEVVCVPQDEILLLTTPNRAATEQLVRVYEVLDLVTSPKGANSDELDYDPLVDLITTIVQPTTWDEVGGPASVGGVGYGCLTIRQTEDVHVQIAHLLAALRRVKDAGAKKNYEAIAVEDAVLTKINASIEKTLLKPCQLDFDDVPLADALAKLRADTKLNLLIDQRALEDAGVALDTPVTAQFSGISLRSALQLMLSPHDLIAEIQSGVLLVTTKDDAANHLVSVVYPVDDLLPEADTDMRTAGNLPMVGGVRICGGGMGGGMMCGTIIRSQIYALAASRADELIETITTSLSPETWDEVGGPGSIAPFADCLAISQTPENHRLIAEWLHDLRHTLAEREKAGIAMPKPSTAPATLIFKQTTLNESPVSYEQQRDNVQQAIALIASTIEPNTWQLGTDQYITHVGSSIVVRHKPAALRKVETLLFGLGFTSSRGSPGCY